MKFNKLQKLKLIIMNNKMQKLKDKIIKITYY